MYAIVVYDVGEQRVAKVCKYLRTVLQWMQNSIFEGELTEAQIERMKKRLVQVPMKRGPNLVDIEMARRYLFLCFSQREKRRRLPWQVAANPHAPFSWPHGTRRAGALATLDDHPGRAGQAGEDHSVAR